MLSRSALDFAKAEVGVRESSVKNDGPRIKAYLAAAGIHQPAAWCAAFVSWCFKQTGSALPRTGWSPALFPKGRLQTVPKPGYVFGIYFPSLKRIAHCGFVESLRGDWIITIEGNTNAVGSREGDGVYRKWRPRHTIAAYAEW